MKKLSAPVIVVSVLVGVPLMGAPPAGAATRPSVVSHRGYTHTGCTENTVCAFRSAAAHDADYVEMDVRFTRTDLPVIMHDSTVGRVTTGHGRVSAMTQSRFTGLRTNDGGHPATLWAALHAAKKGGVRALVELKTNPTAKQWKWLLKKIPSGYRSKIVMQSFSAKAAWAARRHGFPTFRLLTYATTASWAYQYDGEAAPYTDLTKGGVAKLHKHGVNVSAWTVNDSDWWPRLDSMGVDQIVTDASPRRVKAVL